MRQVTLMRGLTPESFVSQGQLLHRFKPLADSALQRESYSRRWSCEGALLEVWISHRSYRLREEQRLP